MEPTPRQIELADAGLAVLARAGLPGLSFRSLAAEAGCSLGSVQKAFSSKSEMISVIFLRLRADATSLPPGEPGRPSLDGWITELLLGVLPLDDARRASQRQADAFAEYARDDAGIAAAIAEGDNEIRGLLASLVRRAIAEGEIQGDVDPDAAAWAVLAVAAGSAAQLQYQARPDDEIRPLLHGTVRRILGL